MADTEFYTIYDKSLYKITDVKPTSQTLDGYLGGSTLINPDGSFDFTNVKLGINQILVTVGGNIQQAMDDLNERGGGKVFLASGTHVVNTALTGYTGVDLEGENQSTTIINFNSTAANLSFVGTSVYATGTITSIASGVNVTGSGTSWLSNVTTDHQIFIGNTWYKIAIVLTDTTLTLAEGYQGNAALPGAAYRASKIIKDVDISNITLTGSTGTALVQTDCRNFRFSNVKLTANNKGFVYTNISEFLHESGFLSVSNTSNGGEITNARLCNIHQTTTPGNGGHGLVLNNTETCSFIECSSNSNTSDGYNLTSCLTIIMEPIEASSNGGQGVELVSGNDSVIMMGNFIGNTSDGVKLTATSDNCHIGNSKIFTNGGYGVNIAASSCDNNLIYNNVFSGNVTANHIDSGTGTVIRGNVGVTDNATSGTTTDLQVFTSSGTWTKPSGTIANSLVIVRAWGSGGGGGSRGGGFSGGGGGGGSFIEKTFKGSEFGGTETITLNSGGTGGVEGGASATAGGTTTIGSILTVYGGGAGAVGAAAAGSGGGGGGQKAVGGNASGATPGDGGSPIGGNSTTSTSNFGGGRGSATTGSESVYGGGGGGGDISTGGASLYGGGGGAGGGGASGASLYGGGGGAGDGSGGSQPGGGGGGRYLNSAGNGGNGGLGKAEIFTII